MVGPSAEADHLHVRQLRLQERLARHHGEFVIWDVGLGAAANAIAVLRATRDSHTAIRLISFDHTLEPLQFALAHAQSLPYLLEYRQPLETLALHPEGSITFRNGRQTVHWSFCLHDFPMLLAQGRKPEARSGVSPPEAPSAILYDPFSPAKNPAMWTLPVFNDLHRRLDVEQPCGLTTYSRSTMIRVTLLLAGFFVGIGHATGDKEETTLAANTLDLIGEPLRPAWLARVRRSTSAEPLHEPRYHQLRLGPESFARLEAHPQFVE